MVSLVLVGVLGSVAVETTRTSLSIATSVAATESRAQEAVAFLSAVSLWTKDDLDRRLGTRKQGRLLLVVTHPKPSLYSVAVLDGHTEEVLLRTSLFRPQGPSRGFTP